MAKRYSRYSDNDTVFVFKGFDQGEPGDKINLASISMNLLKTIMEHIV